ncbi:MAG TPA: hypothetical protein DEQ61_05855, partial [Streptomyces sp.]|nr:hypothetical protein [Streptomyces sp.]
GDGGDRKRPAAADGGTGPASAPPAGPSAPGAPEAVPPGPKEPVSELSPAGGSFTEREKKYLTDRVPKGNDPAAVLQTGQESCDRMAYLVRHDRDMAVSSLILGEIADAGAAADHLCPKQKPLLEDAAAGFPDGTFRVAGKREAGKAITPGRYRAPSPGEDCEWRIIGKGGKKLGSGSWSKGAKPEITVPAGAREFAGTGCYAWLSEGGKG